VLPFKKEISKTEEKEEEEKEGNIFMYFFLREGHKLLILFPQPPECWALSFKVLSFLYFPSEISTILKSL
jgi:hypothetical protein